MPPFNVQQTLTAAVAHHQAGRFDDAQRLYRQVLDHDPNEPDALHLLGVLTGQTGDIQAGIDFIQRAISLRPGAHEFHANLAGFYQRQNKHDLAAASFRRLLQLNPASGEAQTGLSIALRALGQIDAAVAAARRAVALRPDDPLAHNALGIALMDKGLPNEAIPPLKRALDLNPQLPDAHNNLGVALAGIGQTDTAITAHQWAVRLKPDHAGAYSNLAARMREKDRPDEAAEFLKTALRLDPNLAAAHIVAGLLDFDAARLDSAMSHFNRGLAIDPTLVIGQWNRGLLRLLQGDFQNGWPDYEWRLKDPAAFKIRLFPMPPWDGSDLNGRRIVIHSEQGLGDTLQFIRFAPLVAARGGKVIFLCHAELTRLLTGFPGVEQFVPIGQPLPDFDTHLPLLSLPHALKIGANIPAEPSYLHADPERSRHWSAKMTGARPRIGLAWAGRPTHKNDRNRSIHLEQLSPILQLPAFHFYSLQKGDPASEIARLPPELRPIDSTNDLHDFSDTAALVSQLDLIITVDTSVAHLAAAMGKSTWILLPFIPDWRWMLNRDDTPWYPTARLFRQPTRGDWTTVVQRIASELSSSDLLTVPSPTR